MKYIKKLKTLLSITVGWLLYGLSFLISRNKKIWIFIGWHKNNEREIFADNSKYLFLHTSNNIKGIKAIWISGGAKLPKILNKNGYEAYSVNSLKGIYYSLRAGYTVLDAYIGLTNWRYSGGSKIIQLWHGKGPKKIGYDSPYSLPQYNVLKSPNRLRKFYRMIASSDYTAGFVSSSFHFDKKNILVTGLPKHDPLFEDIKGARIDINLGIDNELKKAKKHRFKKIIFYAPTFRPYEDNPISHINLNALNNFLAQKKYFLIGSLHPKFSKQDWMPKIQFTNISFVESGYDIYPLLKKFDMLITDYSSTAVDFVLLDKPVVFFAYDIEKYKKNMGLHEDFWNMLPGPRVSTFEELLKNLGDAKGEEYTKKRRETRNALFAFKDSGASSRIISSINL